MSFEKVHINKTTYYYDYPCSNSTECNGYEIELHSGIWQFELWGASGGSAYQPTYNIIYPGGLGGYSLGFIYLEKPSTRFYLSIGGEGLSNFSQKNTNIPGGFNGGGEGFCGIDTFPGGSGGGSTDIRLGSPDISQRIIIAGGGGGAGSSHSNTSSICYGGHGGGLEGLDGGGYSSQTDKQRGQGGNQNQGGLHGPGSDNKRSEDGILFQGGKSLMGGITSSSGGGGGGCYYGGAGGCGAGGGGGSGYIGGVKNFLNYKSKTLSGNETFQTPYSLSDSSLETGHHGNGFIKITYIPYFQKCSFLNCFIFKSFFKLIYLFIFLIYQNSSF
jgi:hypothetical protein